MEVGLYRSFYTEPVLAFTGLRPSYREDRVCRPARLDWGGEERGIREGWKEVEGEEMGIQSNKAWRWAGPECGLSPPPPKKFLWGSTVGTHIFEIKLNLITE